MRKRSTYRPKPARLDAHRYAIASVQPVALAHGPITTLRLQNHIALECLRTGTGDAQDIDRLVSAANMGIALMCLGLGQDWKAEIEAGADALLAVAQRGAKSGRFVCKGVELTAINTAMALLDLQISHASVRHFEDALAMEQQALRNGKGRSIELVALKQQAELEGGDSSEK